MRVSIRLNSNDFRRQLQFQTAYAYIPPHQEAENLPLYLLSWTPQKSEATLPGLKSPFIGAFCCMPCRKGELLGLPLGWAGVIQDNLLLAGGARLVGAVSSEAGTSLTLLPEAAQASVLPLLRCGFASRLK